MADLPLARAERAALADALAAAGPDAPTLCAGWTTRDLAAHVVVRERRPDTLPGLVVRRLAGWTDRVRRGAVATPYARLVDLVRTGPPAWSPFGWPGVDAVANAAEFLIHHEDVRRARPGWEPRPLLAEVQQAVWRVLPGTARPALARVPLRVVLCRPDGRSIAVGSGPSVTVTGEPAELLLYAGGRREHVRVELAGDLDAVARLRAARVGL